MYNGSYPNLYSVPYPSSIHWRRTNSSGGRPAGEAVRPGGIDVPRPSLMLFLGRVDHGDMQVCRAAVCCDPHRAPETHG